MNANELADKLTEPFADDWREEAAAMLRQQQAEIEALKRPNNVVGVPQDKLADMQATIHEQQAEIEALKTHTVNNKDFEEGYRAGYKFCANMYEANQVKDLSNKEIIDCAKEAGFQFIDNQIVMYPTWTDAGEKLLLKPNLEGTLSDGIKAFAKAILRKAQEK